MDLEQGFLIKDTETAGKNDPSDEKVSRQQPHEATRQDAQ